ncbi:phage Tail Collar domain protein [Escherichia coli 2-011-08_S3_C3]|nr:phage Tail Collar domain protein [Escherichia coli 2-011-08_S3_C3]
MPVGVPVPWPTATPPEGWLKCDGPPLQKNNILFWPEPTRPSVFPIYAVNLFVAGMTDVVWMPGDNYYLHRGMQ